MSGEVKKQQLFAGDMWAVFSAVSPMSRYQTFSLRTPSPLSQFVHSLVLYDGVSIPTQDFINLALLSETFGERLLIELLEANRLRFIRFPSALAYGGNGGGLTSIGLSTADKQQDPMCAPADEAVNRLFRLLELKPSDDRFAKLVVQNTTEVKVSEVMEEIKRETYRDILESCCLRNLFALRNINLDHLLGIESNQVRVYNRDSADNWQKDEISILLTMAASNLELRLGELADCSDASTTGPISQLMNAKAERILGAAEAAEGFTTLREIAEIPDLGNGVLEKTISFRDVIRLSQTRNAQQFREWFHANCSDNPIATAREYSKLLGEVSLIQSLPLKILRFVITTGLGFIPVVGPIAGFVGGGADSFFIERLLRGSSPKFFIEHLRQIKVVRDKDAN